MKLNLNWKILPFAVSLLSSTGCFAQGTETHGGNTRAAHFSSVAKNAVATLGFVCKGSENQLKSCAGLPALNAATLFFTVKPQKPGDPELNGPDGKPREATNDGHSVINLDVDNWATMGTQPNSAYRRLHLALHETSILAGLEQGDEYGYSDQVLEDFLASHVDIGMLVGHEIQVMVIKKPFLILSGAKDLQGERWLPYTFGPLVTAGGLTAYLIPASIGIIAVAGLIAIPVGIIATVAIIEGHAGERKPFTASQDSHARFKLQKKCLAKLEREFKTGIALADGSRQYAGKRYACGDAYTAKVGNTVRYYISIDELIEKN